jgi:hypothetical protein
MSTNSSGYYSHLDTMKKKATMEDAETRGDKLEKKGKVADVSALIKKPVVKVAVKIGKH